MCDEKQTTIERENEDKEKTVERLMNFIKENPYPDYKSIECDLLLKQEQSLEQYAEYGEINLNPIRVFFNFDKDSIRKHGETIHHRGGKTTLQQDYCTLSAVLRHLMDQWGLGCSRWRI